MNSTGTHRHREQGPSRQTETGRERQTQRQAHNRAQGHRDGERARARGDTVLGGKYTDNTIRCHHAYANRTRAALRPHSCAPPLLSRSSYVAEVLPRRGVSRDHAGAGERDGSPGRRQGGTEELRNNRGEGSAQFPPPSESSACGACVSRVPESAVVCPGRGLHCTLQHHAAERSAREPDSRLSDQWSYGN